MGSVPVLRVACLIRVGGANGSRVVNPVAWIEATLVVGKPCYGIHRIVYHLVRNTAWMTFVGERRRAAWRRNASA